MLAYRSGLPGPRRRTCAVLVFATACTACQNKPDEPAPRPVAERKERAPVEPLQNPVASASASPVHSAAPPQEPTEAELAQLPYPPFPGGRARRFLRQPAWARKGAYTLSVEGGAKIDDVSAFYMQRVHRTDPSAQAESVLATYVRIRSTPASVTIDVTVSPDGKTVSAQIGYGMF